MTDQVGFRPTPGKDAMTKAGKRVKLVERKDEEGRSYLLDMLTGNHYSFEGECAYLGDVRQAEPGDRQWRIDEGLDLVADWPDADPIPDADAAQHANWTVVEWSASIRPAPSGPVVEETVKRIVPGVYGRLRVWEEATDDTGDRVARVTFASRNGGHSMGASPVFLTRSELLAAAETLRQIGEAMEGK